MIRPGLSALRELGPPEFWVVQDFLEQRVRRLGSMKYYNRAEAHIYNEHGFVLRDYLQHKTWLMPGPALGPLHFALNRGFSVGGWP